MIIGAVWLTIGAWADTWHVSTNSPSDGPGTTWDNAFHSIQSAVNAASEGDTVLVTNGIYALNSQITITEAIYVESINGAAVTIVDGQNNHRCFNLGTNACVLSGFTVMNGAELYGNGSGVYCENTAPVISNCVFTGNSAGDKNGAVSRKGGGIYGGTVYNSTFSDNSASYGAGCHGSTLNNCRLLENSAFRSGGGSYSGTLNNCLLVGNSASSSGGGSYDGTLNNCTISANSAASGGGSRNGTQNNCIIYGNSGGNAYLSTLNNCWTSDPLFVDSAGGDFHLLSRSPCINAGSNELVVADSDLGGHPRTIGIAVDIGAYEFQDWLAITNPDDISISVPGETSMYALAGTNAACIGQIMAWTNWANGEGGTFVSTAGVWQAIVPLALHDNYIIVTGTNETGEMVSDAVTISQQPTLHNGYSPIHYVSPSGGDIWPFTNWVGAATSIQDAIYTTTPGDTVIVADGSYTNGASIAITNAITVKSVNGPDTTIVDGQSSYRCFSLGDSACILSGFTIANGTSDKGGGVYCSNITPMITNCVLTGNRATSLYDGGGATYYGTLNNCTLSNNSAQSDGGASYGGTLSHCTISGNSSHYGGGSYAGTLNYCTLKGNSSAQYSGGGCYRSTLNSCILTGNSANFGGGSSRSTLNNCTLSGNSASYFGGGSDKDTLNNCIIFDNTINGSTLNSCWTSDPQFMDAESGDYRLQVSSPCIDTGSNTIAPLGTDLDGNDRIIHGTVDIGAYEYAGFINDSDGDSVTDYNEYVAETDPSDSNAWFHVSAISNNTVFFESSSNRLYTLLWSTNLIEGVWSGVPGMSNMGTGGEDSMEFTTNVLQGFYKLQVELPE
jgi:hypothetical protein